MQSSTIEKIDPRSAYPRPPFRDQPLMEMPGKDKRMEPKADHGEESYRGSEKLAGMTAIITGADSGIGRAVALCYAREGANVVLNYLSEEDDAKESESLVRDAGREALCIKGDLREESFCQRLIEDAHQHFGQLDILVCNAAFQETFEEIEEISTESFDRVFKTNVYATFWLARAALSKMTPGSSIINTVSIQGYDPSPNLLPYAATKSALIGMTKGLAKLAIDRGVRANAVAPGPVWTPLIPGSMPAEKVENFGANTLFGRPAQPIELAPLYVWLASKEASYITGEVFSATGGRTPV